MGLDMYLTARRFYWSSEEMPPIPDAPEGYKLDYVIYAVHSWRKANAIHQWFVDNVQDGEDNCQEYYVSREDLRKLREICLAILEKRAAPEEVLPTAEGFFFGSTEYDEWYYSDVKETCGVIAKALVDFPEDKWDFRYSSSW